MARPTRRPTRAVAAALMFVIAFAGLSLTSCAKKITALDSSLQPPVYPEGNHANSDLLVYQDTPVRVVTWFDKGLPGPTADDSLVSDVDLYDFGPGVMIGTIIDSTDASAFEIYRQSATGGYGQLRDVPVRPSKSWLQGQAELYRFTDDEPPAASSRAYLGRGVVNGLVTASAPLTNLARLTRASVAGDLHYRGNVATGFPDTTADSLFMMKWRRVDGAVGYWVTVIALTSAYLESEALQRSALPRPLFPERLPEYFAGYIPDVAGPDSIARYRLGDPGPQGTRVLTRRTTLTGVQYLVRIVAVDADGQVLSYPLDDAKAAIANQRTDTGWIIFPLGGVLVKPARIVVPPSGPASMRPNAPSPWAGVRVGQVVVVHRDQLPAALRP